jgi:hypothetical protein
MVCDNMPLGDHAFYEVRAGLQVVSDDEKRGGNLMLFQGVQDHGGIAVLISGVEGQVDDFLAGKIGVPGIVLL